MFPDNSLPDWIKDFQCENWTDICRAKDALRIAWKALEQIRLYEDNRAGYAYQAQEDIRALGDK